MPSPLQGASHEFLVFLTRAGALAAENFGMRRHKPAQELRVFVVYVANLVFTQKAGSGLELRHHFRKGYLPR
jgi:hypothetical protein